MRTIIYTAVLILLFTKSRAQKLPIDSITGKITYTEIIHADKLSKNDLYSKINEWFAKSYNSATDVIQLNSKEDGKIIGKGLFVFTVIHRYNNIKTPVLIKVAYTLSIYIKDNKFKYEISSFYTITEMGQSPLESYSTDKEKMKEDLKKTFKNENQLEKRVVEQIEFNQAILEKTDKEVSNIIFTLKSLDRKSVV